MTMQSQLQPTSNRNLEWYKVLFSILIRYVTEDYYCSEDEGFPSDKK